MASGQTGRVERLDWIVLVVLVIVWGSAFALLKVATAYIDPAWTAALRTAIAAAFIRLIMAARGTQALGVSLDRKDAWIWYALIGVIGTAAPFFLFGWASLHLDSGLVAILNGGSPIFTTVLAAIVLGESLTRRRAGGVGLGFLGLVALAGPASFGAFGEGGVWAVGAGLLGAFGYALANVWTKLAPKADPFAGSYVYCLTGAIAATVFAIVHAPFPTAAPSSAWIALVALALGPTAIAGVLYVWLVQRAGPVFTSMGTYLTPIWAVFLGFVFLSEAPGIAEFAALGLILAGVWLANSARSRER